MLSLFSPFTPVKSDSDSRLSTKSYFDRLFEETFNNAFLDLTVPKTIGIEYKKNEDNSLAICIEVPGVQEKDLSVEISDNIITVKGERKTSTSSYVVNKSFTVPKDYDLDKVVAELKDGILNLRISPKPLPSKESKKIPILSK